MATGGGDTDSTEEQHAYPDIEIYPIGDDEQEEELDVSHGWG